MPNMMGRLVSGQGPSVSILTRFGAFGCRSYYYAISHSKWSAL